MKYRWILVICLLLLVCMLAACGQLGGDTNRETNDVGTGSGQENETKNPLIGNLPHIVLGADVETDRASYQIVTKETLRVMTVAEKSATFFIHFRNEDTNLLRLSLDDSCVSAFEGKVLKLTFDAYVSESLTVTVQYHNQEGETCEAKGVTSAKNKWSKAIVQMENPKFDGGFDGYDFFVTFTGPEYVRIHEVIFDMSDELITDKPILVQSPLMPNELIVADIDARYFGAKGDGVTDDTEAIQSALAYIEKKGGGTVFLPKGNYVLTGTIDLHQGMSLVGELEQGTTNGTTLVIRHGANSQSNSDAGVTIGHQGALKNVCFYYPEQMISNDGEAVPFPPAVLQTGTESLTLSNIYFVNAYFAIDCATDHENLSLQHIYNIYGCTLNKFYWNDTSYDIGRVENIFLGPEYWLNSGYEAPDENLLKTYCVAKSIGLHLQRIDWTYISDIHINGYYMGIWANKSSTGHSNGHLYNLDFKDVYYGLVGDSYAWFLMTNCKIAVAPYDGATPVLLSKTATGNIAFNSCTFSGGANAVVNRGTGKMTFGDCTLLSSGKAFVSNAQSSFVNTKTGNDTTDYGNQTVDVKMPNYDKINYEAGRPLKPMGDTLIDLSDALASYKGSDIDAAKVIQSALDSLKGKGGIVYVPAGVYTLKSSLHVWEGIELRGATEAATSQCSPTVFSTDWGRNDEDGEALINLYKGSGLKGLRVSYPQLINEVASPEAIVTPYAFTVRGEGENIYIINVSLHSSFNGVDFASERCDNHYVQYLWGCPINVGIQVGGGSKNGIIRDVHYTPNCFAGGGDVWNHVFAYIMSKSRCFYIKDCENEVLYHNFTFAGWRGIEINDGAKDCVVICHGTDCGNYSSYIGGDCTATFIDTQLVNLPGGTPDFRAYIYTAPDYTGEVMFINTGLWGSTIKTVLLEGKGKTTLYQGTLENSGQTAFTVAGGTGNIYAMVVNERGVKYDVRLAYEADDANVVGNIFASGGKFEGDPTVVGNKKS